MRLRLLNLEDTPRWFDSKDPVEESPQRRGQPFQSCDTDREGEREEEEEEEDKEEEERESESKSESESYGCGRMELELQQRPSTFPNITWAMLLGPHFLSSHLLLHSPWLGEPHPIVRTEGSVGSSLYCYALGTPPTCQNSSLFRGFDPSRPRLLNQRISSSKDYLNVS